MSRYIDVDKLKIRFGNEMLKVKIRCNDDAENVLSDVLDSMPAADVQPVRRGEWEHTCICSECGQVDYSAPNYCPNCGAKMEEENE